MDKRKNVGTALMMKVFPLYLKRRRSPVKFKYTSVVIRKWYGNIDAFGSTPLYTNGQFSVNELIYNGNAVWSRIKSKSNRYEL